MTTYGVTATGFVKKDFAVILAEIKAEGEAQWGASLNTENDSVFGNLANIHSNHYSELWDVAQAVYNSFYPDTATNDALDGVCALIGINRLPATYSSCEVTGYGTVDTVIPTNFTVSVDGESTKQFRPAASQIINASGYAVFDVVSIIPGAVRALAGKLTVIETPILGIDSVNNALDATEGRDVETDAELRARRESSLADPGTSTANAIRAKILELTGVTACVVYENRLDVADGEGRPGHSFEVVVLGGDDADIAQCILDNGPIGIETFGSTTVTVTTDSDQDIDINFTRPTEDDIYITVDLTTDSEFPTEGETTVLNDILDFGDLLSIGDDVITWKLQSSFSAVLGITGVVTKIGTAPNPSSSSNITIANTHVASFDSSRIKINIS